MGLVVLPATTNDRVEAGPVLYQSADTKKATFRESFAASFVEENSIAQWAADLEHQIESDAVEGYNQYKDIPEDLGHMPIDVWRGVRSPVQMQGRIAEIRAEQERRAIAATNGWGSFVGAISGYLLSPETVPELLLTQGRSGAIGAVRVGAGVLLGETAHEAALHSESYSRTMQESLTNIGLSTFAGAGIGYAIGRSTQRQYTKELRKAVSEAAEPSAYVKVPKNARSIGAAELAEGYESIVNKPWLNWKWLAPVRPLAHASSKVAQKAFNSLVEHSYTPLKTLYGEAKQIALETRVNREIAVVATNTNKAMTKGYKDWLGEQAHGLTRRLNPLTMGQFQKELHLALVSKESAKNASKAVQETAKALRTEYDNIFRIAKEIRGKGDDLDDFLSLEEYAVKWADSYAPRRYNKRRIMQDRVAFKLALREAYKSEREKAAFLEAAKKAQEEGTALPKLEDFTIAEHGSEMNDIIKNVDASYDRIVNNYDLDVFMPVKAKGTGDPFKERKIPIRDEVMIEAGWLDSAMHPMLMSYASRVLKPARMLEAVGDTEMKGVLDAVIKDYGALEEAAIKARQAAIKAGDKKKAEKFTKKAAEIDKERTRVRESFEVWRDRYYGRTTISTSRHAESVNNIMRVIRNLNVARLMGMVLPVSVGDIFRTNLTTIFAPELGKTGPGIYQALKTIKESAARGFSMADFGIAHEVASYVRTGKIIDDAGVIDTASRAVEWSGILSKGLMRATGLAHWTDWNKLVAAAYTQNDLLQKMRGFAKLSGKNKQALAQLGIDEKWVKRLDAELALSKGKNSLDQSIVELGKNVHGYDGIGYVMQWDNFADQKLAKHLQDVIFMQSERNIVSPAAGDIPRLTASDEVNKTIFQFQSFLFSAAHSVTVNLARRMQMRDPKAIMLLTNMVIGGMLATGIRGFAYGREEEMAKWGPQDWVMNGIDYSGAVPILMMGFNNVNMFTGNAIVNAMGMDSMQRYAYRPGTSLAGPSAGFTGDALLSLGSLGQIVAGQKDLTPGDIRRMRRLLPFNNFVLFSRGVTNAQEALQREVE